MMQHSYRGTIAKHNHEAFNCALYALATVEDGHKGLADGRAATADSVREAGFARKYNAGEPGVGKVSE